MPTVTFIDHYGNSSTVLAEAGTSLMQAATANGVEGIAADCGGACACATCHVYIDDAWSEAFPAASSGEQEMLAFVDEIKETSRLACQVTVEEQHEGLVVHTPEKQGA
jgi:ferredoxin, 2Fe-2S